MKSLSANCSVAELNYIGNEIGMGGCRGLLPGLEKNLVLKKISLTWNEDAMEYFLRRVSAVMKYFNISEDSEYYPRK